MDDVNAFERQVAGEVIRAAAPARPVDVAAVFTAIAATQSPKWRFQSMFSATKFVVAGAIVALFNGFLLAGVLTQPQSDDAAPAAVASATAREEEAAISPPVEFTGKVICGDPVRRGTTHWDSWYEGRLLWKESRGDAWRQTVTMSDPRLEGEVHLSVDSDAYSYLGSDGIEAKTLNWATYRIENDEGAWQGSAVTFDLPGESDSFTPGDRQTYVLIGEGGYEGLTAIFDAVPNAEYRPCGGDIDGLIFEGAPAVAEPFVAE